MPDADRPLDAHDLDSDPMRQFAAWLADAEAAGIPLADAVALATAAPDGMPSARMVLLKGADADGFVFFSNYESRKGRELAENPRAALLFYWHGLGRQIRVEGAVERIDEAESDAYFATRPRGSQIGAWASPQSTIVPHRGELERRAHAFDGEHAGDVPRPPFWGGYRIRPGAIEFWQHRENRLHDRFRYSRAGDGWTIERLAP